MMNREELAWVGGFYSGEGGIGFYTNGKSQNGKTYSAIRLQISQADGSPESLERILAAIGFGQVAGPYSQGADRWNPVYLYTIGGFEKVQALIAMIWPWLTERKKKQAKSALLAAQNYHLLMKKRGK
jgi:hypothetical protein